MSKDIAYDNETRAKLAAGVHKLAEAVKVTVGPQGRYVALQAKGFKDQKDWLLNEYDYRGVNVTNDGATVAANIDVTDPIEQMGISIVRESAIAANNEAGDGTSTATILSDAIVREGVRNVIAGAEPLALRRGIQAAADAVEARVKENAVTVSTHDQIAQVATISSGDPEIGEKIACAIDEIGKDGVISVEKSQSFGMELNFLKGLMFENGFISPHMADDPGTMTGELTQPYILMTDEQLRDNFRDIVPVLEEVIQSGHPLLILADDVRGESLNTLVLNRSRGVLNCVAVKAPGLGDRRKTELQDVAVLTGGEVLTADRGLTLKDARKSMLGRAETVQISKDRTLIIGGKGKKEAIEERCNQIRHDLELPHTDYDRDVLRERLAKLTGGIAVMKVGAATEAEMNEIRSRIQDALMATRSAIEQGLVAGGGVALFQAAKAVDELTFDDPDEQLGADILKRACSEPLRCLAENAGFNGDIEAREAEEWPLNYGLNTATREHGDMIEMGVTDPTKVTCTALQAAASVSSMILITNAAVIESKLKEAEK